MVSRSRSICSGARAALATALYALLLWPAAAQHASTWTTELSFEGFDQFGSVSFAAPRAELSADQSGNYALSVTLPATSAPGVDPTSGIGATTTGNFGVGQFTVTMPLRLVGATANDPDSVAVFERFGAFEVTLTGRVSGEVGFRSIEGTAKLSTPDLNCSLEAIALSKCVGRMEFDGRWAAYENTPELGPEAERLEEMRQQNAAREAAIPPDCRIEILRVVGTVEIIQDLPAGPQTSSNIEIGGVNVGTGGGRSGAIPLDAGTRAICAHDTIYTGMESSVTYRTADGKIVTVGELADVVPSRKVTDAEPVKTRLRLEAGRISVEIENRKPVAVDLSVETGEAGASPRATIFTVDRISGATPRTIVRVTRGTVEVTPVNPDLPIVLVHVGGEVEVTAYEITPRGDTTVQPRSGGEGQESTAASTVAAPVTNGAAGSCDISGDWRMRTENVGESVWTFVAGKEGHYSAQEHGLGNATGTAVLRGSTIHIDWQTGGWSGTVDIELDAGCTVAQGTQVIATGSAPGSYPTRFERVPVAPAQATGADATFPRPRQEDAALDWCLTWATDCGQPAADRFCATLGYAGASGFKTYAAGRTYVAGSAQYCEGPHCLGFEEISCTRGAATAGASAGAPAAASGACDISGEWRMRTESIGESVWTFVAAGENRYTAQESGLGNATGSAFVEGSAFHLDWQAGTWSGDIDLTLNEACGFGEGVHLIETGEPGRHATRFERLSGPPPGAQASTQAPSAAPSAAGAPVAGSGQSGAQSGSGSAGSPLVATDSDPLIGSWQGCDGRVIEFRQEAGLLVGRYTALGGLGGVFQVTEAGYFVRPLSSGGYSVEVRHRFSDGSSKWVEGTAALDGNTYSDTASDSCSRRLTRLDGGPNVASATPVAPGAAAQPQSPPASGQASATSPAGPPASPQSAGAAAACDFTGTWRDNYGVTITLTQNGTAVSGSYAFQGVASSITGVVTNGLLTGIYQQPTYPDPAWRSGAIVASLAGCDAWSGSALNSTGSATRVWTATRVAPGAAAGGFASIRGMWVGFHECAGVEVGTAAVVEVDPGGRITGVRQFYPTGDDSGRAVGSFLVGGRFDPSTGEVSLLAENWIHEPPGYGKCDFHGRLDASGNRITGASPDCGCGDFALERQ